MRIHIPNQTWHDSHDPRDKHVPSRGCAPIPRSLQGEDVGYANRNGVGIKVVGCVPKVDERKIIIVRLP